MSYIYFNDKENSILVCKGKSWDKKDVEKKESHKNYEVFYLNDNFEGVKISNFLSPLEQDGLKAELRFKELLEINKIPYLYIGQGPFGIERSGILIDETKSKRADFLVNLKDMGTILFDVKSRNKISFHNNEEKFFPLFVSELNALYNLQNSILMPVWVAFIDKNHIKNKSIFYFVSISSLMNFLEGMANYSIDTKEIIVLRIPDELLTRIDERIIFEVGHQNVNEQLLEKFAKRNIGLNRVIKDKIKEGIRNKKCFKSKIYENIKYLNINFCFKQEVNYHLNEMINLKVVEYQKKEVLRLSGE